MRIDLVQIIKIAILNSNIYKPELCSFDTMKRGGVKNSVLLLLVFSLIITFLAGIVVADALTVEITPPTQTIAMNGVASFDATISHAYSSQQIVEVYVPDVLWDLSTEPTSDRTIQLAPFTTKKTKIMLKPLYVNPGNYFVPVYFRIADTNTIVVKNLLVSVRSLDDVAGDYTPTIVLSLKTAQKLDPREALELLLTIDNKNPRTLNNIDVKIRSEQISQDKRVNVSGLETKDAVFTTRINPLTPPQKEFIRVSSFVNDKNKTYQFDAEPVSIEIQPYGEVASAIKEQNEFLKKTQTITAKNTGNIQRKDILHIPASTFQRWFTKTIPAIDKSSEGYSWSVSLNVGEQQTLTIVTNYRMPTEILLVLIAILILYYLFRSPATVQKVAVVLATKEGGMAEFKVQLLVRNRSSKKLKHVILADRVPKLVLVEKDFDIGTLKPESVTAIQSGTLVKWVIEDLDAHEERIITYKIRSRLSILGTLSLPSAVIKFETAPGKIIASHSNIPRITQSKKQGKVYD